MDAQEYEKMKIWREIQAVGETLKPYLTKHDIPITCVDKSVQAKYENAEMRRRMKNGY